VLHPERQEPAARAAAAAGAQLAAALGLPTADRDVLLLFAWGQLRHDEVAAA
jgi:hypothetical protein